MTKQDILNTTGLSEEEFYQRYPDQETFCSEYPEMCPDMMDDEDVSNEYVVESDYDDSLYEAQDGVQTTAPYTDYNQYQNAMQNYYAEASKANAYNNFQNDLYNLSGKTKGFSETPKQMGDMFNTLSPEQQDAFAQKHGAEFITNTPSSNRKNYINSMQMTVPGKGTGYYSFPTNDVVYGRKDLERPKYDFPKMTAPQYPMPVTSPTNFQGKPINYQPGTATINLGNTNQQSKLNSLQSIRPNFQPTQIINNVGASYKDPASLNASNGNLPIPKYSLNRTMEKVGATNEPFVTSTPSYTSIVDLLKARKEDSSFTNRKRMAEEAGIKNYTGTASQNMDLINRINNSKASGAGMTSSSQLQNQTQQNNKPFYSPSNTPASYINNDKQFYPAKKYTSIVDLFKDRGEDSSFSNRKKVAEKKGIKNYRGSAKQNVEFINRMDDFNPYSTEMELGGENMFVNGGLVKYQKKGEVKMTYRDFLNYVDYPEMIQVDGMRSAYEPETNTIFYDTPRSLPDELSHAVQRATGSFGYSVPPNYTTMMMKIPAMRENLKYKYNRENLDPELVNKNAGEYNTIRLKNVPSDSGNSLSNAYVKRYPADYKIAGDAFLKKLNDSNIYMVPGSVEQEAHQLFEPRIRQDFFNYFKPQYKQGGYYGMDGRLHRAKGSGTYVMNGGYYFDPGGENTKPPIASPDTVAGAMGMGDPIAVPQSSLAYNNSYQDYSFDMGANEADGSSMGYSIDTDTDQTNSSSMGQQSMIDPYDASKYSSAIDPSTGFTTWSKNNQALTNIKKQDPALWGHLKDEGKGARWRTGQTDFQKFGRTAGYIGNVLENGINVASGIGNIINNRNEQRNLNNSAINKGSTASMYTNPQAAGKGTGPGQTGSIYGMMDPDSIGARSFTGMYGKYGMQVPKYDIGGGFSNLFTSAQSVIPITKPMNLIPSGGYFTDSNGFNPFQNNMPIVDNTGVYQNNRAVNETDGNNNTVINLDPDFALQAVASIESGSKPGQAKVGMPTKLVGEGGKKASASGTFQITEQTLHEIFNKDKSISSKYKNFNTFKNAFDTDSKVEYEAARSLMVENIKKYNIFALGAWYYPEFARKAAAGDKSVFDIVPRRDFGNNVKWGDDFKLKLDAYNKAAGTNYTPNTIFNAPKPVAQKKYITPPGENPMARKTFRDFQTEFSGITNMGIWGDARHKEKKSDHNTADALDIGIKNVDQGNQVVQKLIKEAKDRNIKYIIFNSRIWDAKSNTWSAYYGDNPHKTHVHTSFYRVKKQLGGQVMEMDEDEIKQFLKAGGQLEFLD